MRPHLFSRVKTVLAVALAAAGAVAFGQAPFPRLTGNNAGTGRNANPALNNPGQAFLRWFQPYSRAETVPIELDNTDVSFTLTPAYLGGPYDRLPIVPARLIAPNEVRDTVDEARPEDAYRPFGQATSVPPFRPQVTNYNLNTEWIASPEENAATGAIIPYNWLYAPYTAAAGGPQAPTRVQQPRSPAYVLTRSTASVTRDTSTDPTLAATPADRRYFEWTVRGAGGGARSYALYANLLTGPTTINGTRIFPQRYYVFEILFAGNQRVVDVVDTYAAGTGYVRLGGGGLPNNATFLFDGTTAIRVRLYNTVPRNEDNNLVEPPAERVVYADALEARPTSGRYDASPILTEPVDPLQLGTSSRVVAAQNRTVTEAVGLNPITRTRGEVRSYDYTLTPGFDPTTLIFNQPTPTLRWTHLTPTNSNEVDRDDEGSDVTPGLGWNRVNEAKFLNGSFLQSPPLVIDAGGNPAGATYTRFQPDLSDGQYDIFAYLPGDTTTVAFGKKVRYRITEASNNPLLPAPVVTLVEVDQSQQRGWVRLGSRRFRSRIEGALPLQALRVEVANFSRDTTDNGKFAYADGIRFVGDGSAAIRSTPVYATARVRNSAGVLADRPVVLVADETGRIQCLDAIGRPDGTTDVYWTYPSTPRTNVTDPNISEGIDGLTSTVAEMPRGFDLSTGLVQRVGTEDYFYVGSTNGRVYCIAMDGRGDSDFTNRVPGTTRRVWSFPNDFPDTSTVSNLGRIRGSVTYGLSGGQPTIFIPAGVGRVYAVDALPADAGLRASRDTAPRWVFPALNQPTMGTIQGSPLYEFNSIYIGGQGGVFYRINAGSGTLAAQFPTPAQVATGNAEFQMRGFTASAASANAPALGGLQTASIFAADDNGYVYALRADTLEPIWNEYLGASVRGALTFTQMRTQTRRTTFLDPVTIEQVPTVVAPTRDGRIVGLFALASRTTGLGNRAFYTYQTRGSELVASVAAGGQYLFAGDDTGFLYGLSENDAGGSFNPGIFPPGGRERGDDDPAGDVFREAKLRFITRAGYQRLRLPPGAAEHPDFDDIVQRNANPREIVAEYAATPGGDGTYAFEWGETVYAIVYDFPYQNRQLVGATRAVPPPVVNISFAVGGETVRAIPVESRQFTEPPNAPLNAANDTLRNNGYAVVAFTFQGGGPNAVPPGEAEVSATISSQALSPTRTVENVTLNPAQVVQDFVLANPLAVYMVDPGLQQTLTAQQLQGYSDLALRTLGIGGSKSATAPENRVNGNPNLDVDGIREDRLLASAGAGNHGGTNKARFFVADRSLMGLIRPDGLGLDNVRVNVAPLAWQGGAATVYKGFSQTLYPNFEDLPTQFPNVSVDYPDIRTDAISVVKDPEGRAENPLFNSVSLRSSRIGGNPITEDNIATPAARDSRVLSWTPVDINLNIPRFQPPNRATNAYDTTALIAEGTVPADPRYYQPNSNNLPLPQGYISRFGIYVDSTQNGALDEAAREAFRAFSVSTSVVKDEQMRVITPQVDTNGDGIVPLGSLAGGTGYTLQPYANIFAPNTPTFSPYSNVYGALFQPFTVLNEGNVNMLDVRLAKWSGLNPATVNNPLPWELRSGTNDYLAWMDGSMNMWSNFDRVFAPRNRNGVGNNAQIIQKSRVGDTIGTPLKVNPSPRLNPNLSATPQPVSNDTPANLEPKVAVTVPFGFPVGAYSAKLRVIENKYNVATTPPSESPALSEILGPGTFNGTIESFTQPTFDVRFNVRETRLTGGATPRTDTQIDPNYGLGPNQPTFSNVQPTAMRDPFGSLIMAWTSNRPGMNVSPADAPEVPYRIYFASLDNAGSFGTNGYSSPGTTGISTIRQMANISRTPNNNNNGGRNSLRDLDFWVPQNGSWFKKSSQLLGYPNPGFNNDALFGTTIVPNTARFGSPSFPSQGRNKPLNPYAPTDVFGAGFMAFVGEARTAGGDISRIFLARVSTDAEGTISVGDPIPMVGDRAPGKGRPTIVQTGENTAIVLFPVTSGNATTIQYARYDGNSANPWFGPTPLPFGDGFSSVDSIAATIRNYENRLGDIPLNTPIMEIAFTGRLKGGSSADAYIARIPIPNNQAAEKADGTLAADLVWGPSNLIPAEEVTNVGSGEYRSSGVDWDRAGVIVPRLLINGVYRDLIVPASRFYDGNTGRISYDTNIGGRIILDPAVGTLRLTGGAPPRNARLVLDYAPRFRRVSDGTGASSGANIQFDRRPASELSFWRTQSNAQLSDQSSSAIQTARLDRTVVAYTRAGGQGQAARPYMRTLRLGVRLNRAIYVAPDGSVPDFSVTGQIAPLEGPYQIDPANGQVYFTSIDEGKLVAITYRGIVPGTGAPTAVLNEQDRGPRLLEETRETLIPIEQAINETGLTLFLDPYNPIANANAVPGRLRPNLMWLLWSSTRGGAPDLFMESFAPLLSPIRLGN